jgi:hypothetical protein
MPDEQNESHEKAVKDFVKEVSLSTYSALNTRTDIYLNRQNSIIGWLIGLIGVVVAFLTTYKMPLLCDPPLVIVLFAFIFAIELLISYWIYQLYQITLINDRIFQLEQCLLKYLHLPSDIFPLYWHDKEQKEKSSYKLSEYSQPLSLYVTAIIGLCVLYLTLKHFQCSIIDYRLLWVLYAALWIALLILYKIHSKVAKRTFRYLLLLVWNIIKNYILYYFRRIWNFLLKIKV